MCDFRHCRQSASGRLVALLAGLACSSAVGQPAVISPATMPRVGAVDERFQSYNVEMAEVIGGNFWRPYDKARDATRNSQPVADDGSSGPARSQAGGAANMFEPRPPIDLANARLRKLAAALGPAYVRVSGTWANTVYFHNSDTAAPASPPRGFKGILTRPQWRGVVEFTQAVDAKLTMSFAISGGVRDATGVWTPGQAGELLAYTKEIGAEIAAAEFFNEPNVPEFGGAPAGYSAADYARDFAAFRSFASQAAPNMRILGPASVGEAGPLSAMSGRGPSILDAESLLSASPGPEYDIFSYHFYGAASIRCAGTGAGVQTTVDAALSEDWLTQADRSAAFYAGLRDRFQPGKPIWITEIADAACGGNPWAKTFLDTFRYLDQHGRLARNGVSVTFHNTLASSDYGLLDQQTFGPRPNYWAALLWHHLMGTTVLDPGTSGSGLSLYAQCLRRHPGGVTLLAINISTSDSRSVELPLAAERYTLTAERLEAANLLLNGKVLELDANGDLPALNGRPIAPGEAELPPASISLFAVEGAANPNCW